MLRRKALPSGGQGRWISRDGKLVLSTHMRSNEPAYDANNPILRGGQPVKETAYLTDAFTREAVDFIGGNKERPFFLYVAYNAVHSPLQGADAWMRKFSHIKDVHRRIFAAMLANLDDGVGQVLAKLRKEKLEENTLVIFLSDNGGPTRELTSSNKTAPRRQRGRVRRRNPRSVLNAMERQAAGWWCLSATRGFARHLCHRRRDRPTTDSQNPPNRRSQPAAISARQAKIASAFHAVLATWAVVLRFASATGNCSATRAADETVGWELYDLAKDFSEKRDLAKQETAKLAELTAAWKRMNGKMKTAPLVAPPARVA